MKLYGSLSRLVSILFRKDAQDITLRPNQSTTYSAARDIQLPPGDAAHVLVSASSTQTFTNKTFDADGAGNSISNIENADIKAAAGIVYSKLNLSNSIVNADIASGAAIDATKIADGSVTSTEFQYIGGLTSDAQTQLDGKASTALSNLASVAINVSLVSDTNNTDDLGSDSIEWKDAWVHSVKHNDASNPDLLITTTGNNGDIELTPHGTGNVNVNDAHLQLASGTSAAELRFYEPSGSGTNYTAFKAQAQAGDVTYTLPAADAAVSGYVLSSNASGVLSWVSNASVSSYKADWTDQTATVTFTNATNKVNYTSHGLENGQTLYFTNSGGALPSGITSGQIYYVINKSANDFEISASYGGSAVDFTTDGTGTNTANVTSKAFTHGLATQDLVVQVYDKDDGFQVEFDEIIRISTTHVIVNGTELPGGTGFRVMILAA